MKNQHELLIELAHYKMPFGKYKGSYLVDIPEAYYIWFRQRGYPEGKLGRLFKEMYEIKLNGLEDIIHDIQKNFPRPDNLRE